MYVVKTTSGGHPIYMIHAHNCQLLLRLPKVVDLNSISSNLYFSKYLIKGQVSAVKILFKLRSIHL